LHANVGVALVFVGEETGWDAVGEKPACGGKNYQQHDDYRGFFHEDGAPADITLGCAIENSVEPAEKFSQQPTALFLWLEQQGRQRRTES
jgi:hypothetical protein